MNVPAYKLKQSFILRASNSTPSRDRSSVDGRWRRYRAEGFGGGSSGASRVGASAKAKEDGGFRDRGVSGAGGGNAISFSSGSVRSLRAACIFKLSISRCIAALLHACQVASACARGGVQQPLPFSPLERVWDRTLDPIFPASGTGPRVVLAGVAA